MPEYLIILLSVLASLFIFVLLYLTYTFRKICITTKKLDYLIEDITYKSEMLSPVIDSLIKLSTYVSVIDVAVKKTSGNIEKVVKNNFENIQKFNKQLEKVLLNEKNSK